MSRQGVARAAKTLTPPHQRGRRSRSRADSRLPRPRRREHTMQAPTPPAPSPQPTPAQKAIETGCSQRGKRAAPSAPSFHAPRTAARHGGKTGARLLSCGRATVADLQASDACSGRHASAPSGRVRTTATAGESGRKPGPVDRLLIVLRVAERTSPPGRPSVDARPVRGRRAADAGRHAIGLLDIGARGRRHGSPQPAAGAPVEPRATT